MTQITLSYLQSLSKRTRIISLERSEQKILKLIAPLQEDLQKIESELQRLRRSKPQAIIEYYIETAVIKAFGESTEVDWRKSDLQKGVLEVYRDYGHGDTDSWRATVNEDLTVVKV